MQTYHNQTVERIGRDNAEAILGIVVLVVLVACGLAGVSLPSRAASEPASLSLHRDQMRAAEIQQLRTRNGSLEDELKKLSETLDDTREDLASFRQVHDTLIAQVAVTTAKMQEIEGRIQDTKAQTAKLNEYASLQEKLKKEYTTAQEQLKRERDEALGQADDAAQRIRELTLQLQRAGVYP